MKTIKQIINDSLTDEEVVFISVATTNIKGKPVLLSVDTLEEDSTPCHVYIPKANTANTEYTGISDQEYFHNSHEDNITNQEAAYEAINILQNGEILVGQTMRHFTMPFFETSLQRIIIDILDMDSCEEEEIMDNIPGRVLDVCDLEQYITCPLDIPYMFMDDEYENYSELQKLLDNINNSCNNRGMIFHRILTQYQIPRKESYIKDPNFPTTYTQKKPAFFRIEQLKRLFKLQLEKAI